MILLWLESCSNTPGFQSSTRLAIASIAEVLLCQFGSKGPGITEFLLICLNTSLVFSVEIPRKRANNVFLFFFWRVFVNLFIIQSYLIRLVWTFHPYFFIVEFYILFPTRLLGFTSLSKGAHLAQAFFQASVTLTAFFADECPFLESINQRIWW